MSVPKPLKYHLALCLFSILLCLTYTPVLSQGKSYLDSAKKYANDPGKALSFVKKSYEPSINDSLKAKALLFTGNLYTELSHYDSALIFLNESLAIFKAINDTVHLGECYESLGVAYEYKSEYTSALTNYQSAYELRKMVKRRRDEALSLNSIGNIHVFLDEYPKALALFFEALKIGEEIHDPMVITRTYNNIGTVYDYSNNLDKALEYYLKAKDGFQKEKNESGYAGALNNIGLVYKNLGKPREAIPYYEEALTIYNKLKSGYGVGVLQNNLGVAYELLGDLEQAVLFHTRSLETNMRIGNPDGISNSNNSIGQCYLKQQQFSKAIMHFSKALEIAKAIPSRDRIAEAYEGLSKGWEGRKDYQKSLNYFREASAVRDSILSADKVQQLLEMEEKYETALKAKQIALLHVESEKQKLAIDQQQQLISRRNLQLALVVSLAGLIGLIVYISVSRIKPMYQAKMQVLQYEKEQAIIRSVYEQRLNISKDMHDEIGSGLTHIAMLSELVSSQNSTPDTVRKEVDTISETSRKLIESMSEIIWALNPHNESLDNLIAYIREQSNKYFDPFDVRYEMNIPEVIPDVKLTNIQRRNLFLVTKEVLNNALKHSGADWISLRLSLDGSSVVFAIHDNGKGILNDKIRRSANGLKNMKSRMEEIGGEFTYGPANPGTLVSYSIPVQLL